MIKYLRNRKAAIARVKMLGQISSRGEIAYQMDAVEAAIKADKENNIVPRDMSEVEEGIRGLRISAIWLDEVVDDWSRM